MTGTTTRPMPWDVMGTALAANDRTDVATTIKAAGLDFRVETREAFAGDQTLPRNAPEGAQLLKKRVRRDAPAHQAIVRPMPGGGEKVLAFTKKRYTPIQNGDAFAVADYLVKEFGATISGAADFRSGERSLLSLHLGEDIVVRNANGEDVTGLYLLIMNDHAGNAALTFALTPVRFDCTNALPAAIGGAERIWKISHTPNAMERVALAQSSILKAMEYRDAFQEKAQEMLDTEMVDREFQKMVQRLWPAKADDESKAADKRREIQSELMTAWATSPTIDTIRGTRWAGYNVVTEYLDHFRPVRGEAKLSRAEGALDGPYVRQKAKLWDMFAAA